MSLSADAMTLYGGNPKDSTKSLLKLTKEFSKVSGYNINMPPKQLHFNRLTKHLEKT